MTPFLASGHLKSAGYPGKVRRLLKRRGLDAANVDVKPRETIDVGGTPRRAIHFHRFRSRGREVQPDAAGALLDIVFPRAIEGPLAIGYGSHFGLAPGWRLGTEDGAALWATLVPHDDRRVIEAKHGREEEVWWTRSDASC